MVSDVAQVKAGCEVLAAQARRSGRPVPKSLASPGDVATPEDHGAFFRGERQVPPRFSVQVLRGSWRRMVPDSVLPMAHCGNVNALLQNVTPIHRTFGSFWSGEGFC